MSLSIEDKGKIAKLFGEWQKTKTLPDSEREFVKTKNEEFWTIAKDDKADLANREAAYDFINMCHQILQRKYDPAWKENLKKYAGGKGGKSPFIATAQMRGKNCDDFIKYVREHKIMEDNPSLMMALAFVWGSVK